MTNLIELDCMEFIEDAKPFILVVYYGAFRGDTTELNIPARKMYDTLVKMGYLNIEHTQDGVIQSSPLPFSEMKTYIDEMDFEMQKSVLNDYLLFTDQQKRLN